MVKALKTDPMAALIDQLLPLLVSKLQDAPQPAAAQLEPDPVTIAVAQAEDDRIAAMSAPVLVEALGLISFDGNPETEGAEWYAPLDFDAKAHCAENGIDGDLIDSDGAAIVIVDSRFTCARIQAEALVKAKAVRIVA